MRTYLGIILIFCALPILHSCIGKNHIHVKNKSSQKEESNFALNSIVSTIKIINHQVVITGSELQTVSEVKINDGSSTHNLRIESNNGTTLIANTLSDVLLPADKILNFIIGNANAAATYQVNFSLCDSSIGGKGINCTITPNDKEVLSYDASSGKWKPRAVNGLNYLGTFDASSGIAPNSSGMSPGDYFIINIAGTINSHVFQVGDWIVYSTAGDWQQINNSSVINSVFGRTGTITANKGDYNLNKLSDVDLTTTTPTTGNTLLYNGTNWVPGTINSGTVTQINANSPLSVTNPTTNPTISIGQATNSNNGYLTSSDWNLFNSKQSNITAGTITQYYRGDKTWQTLDTSSVSENSNLYFTNARTLGVPLNGLVTTDSSSLSSSDSLLIAMGKLQGQLNNKLNSSSFIDWTQTQVTNFIEPRNIYGGGTLAVEKLLSTDALGFVIPSSISTAGSNLKFESNTDHSLTMGTAAQDEAGKKLLISSGEHGIYSSYTAVKFGGDLVLKSGMTTFNSEGDAYLNNFVSASVSLQVPVEGTAQVITTPTRLKADSMGVEVNGQYRNPSFDAGTSNSINWNMSNNQITAYDCASLITLNNLLDGGTYTLVVTGTGAATCNFSTPTLTQRFRPGNGVRIANSHTIYTFFRVGTNVYITYATGF